MPDLQPQPHGSPDLPDALKKQIAEVDAMYSAPPAQPVANPAAAPEGAAQQPPAAQPQEPPASHGQPPEMIDLGAAPIGVAASISAGGQQGAVRPGYRASERHGCRPGARPPAAARSLHRCGAYCAELRKPEEAGVRRKVHHIVGRRAKEVYARG
jgi:hypothetical protein